MIKEILSFEIIILILAARFSLVKKECTSLSGKGRDSLCHDRPQHAYPKARIQQVDCLRGFMRISYPEQGRKGPPQSGR